MKAIGLLLVICLAATLARAEHEDLKSFRNRIIQKRDLDKARENLRLIQLQNKAHAQNRAQIHNKNQIFAQTSARAKTKDPQFDPQATIRKLEDVKSTGAVKQFALEKENKLQELNAKLADLALDKRRASEKIQTEEIGTLEKRVMKMEEVTNQLSRAAHQQIELLKEIQDRQRLQGTLIPPTAPSAGSNLNPLINGDSNPQVDTIALDYVFQKVVAELNANPPSAAALAAAAYNGPTSIAGAAAAAAGNGAAAVNVDNSNPTLSAGNMPLGFTSTPSTVNLDNVKIQETSSTVTMPTPSSPSATINTNNPNAPRFVSQAAIKNALTHALSSLAQQQSHQQPHQPQPADAALAGLTHPTIISRQVLHGFTSPQSTKQDDPLSRLPVVAQYRN